MLETMRVGPCGRLRPRLRIPSPDFCPAGQRDRAQLAGLHAGAAAGSEYGPLVPEVDAYMLLRSGPTGLRGAKLDEVDLCGGPCWDLSSTARRQAAGAPLVSISRTPPGTASGVITMSSYTKRAGSSSTSLAWLRIANANVVAVCHQPIITGCDTSPATD